MNEQHLSKIYNGANVKQKRGNDEYYTSYALVDEALTKYKDYFKGRVVVCFADDTTSNFYKCLKDRYEELELLGIRASHINGTLIYYDGEQELITEGDGDLFNQEPPEEPNILFTNPPFSVMSHKNFKEKIMSYDDFLLMAYQLFSSYVVYQDEVKAGVIKGYSIPKSTFETPEGTTDRSDVIWITTLPVESVPVKFISYPKYDDYDAYEIGRIDKIPDNFYEVMGVPVTYWKNFDWDTFDIVNSCAKPYLNGKQLFARMLIKRKDKPA